MVQANGEDVLCGVGLVVHQEELDIVGVLNEEGLVARGHHVAGLLVGAIADLLCRQKRILSVRLLAVGETTQLDSGINVRRAWPGCP
jgi:hypothetical protein